MSGFSPDVAELRAALIKMTIDLAETAYFADPRCAYRLRRRVQDNFRDLIGGTKNDELAKSLRDAFRDVDALLGRPDENFPRRQKPGGPNDIGRQPTRRR